MTMAIKMKVAAMLTVLGVISVGAAEVTDNVSGINQTATETGAASTQVLETAKGLATQVDGMSQQIDRFLKSLNAA
jgi:methyl-accepting chemotaxis protein